MSAVLGVLAAGAARALLAAGLLLLLSLVGFAALPDRLRPERATLALPVSLSAGACLTGLVLWIAGWFLGTRTALPLFVLLVLVSVRRSRAWARALVRTGRRLGRLLRASPAASLLLLAPLLVLVPNLVAPLVDSDGIRYHAALPKLFVLTGRVFYYPWDVTGAFPQTGEMLYLLGFLLGGGETAKFLNAGFFVAALSVLALTVHRNRRTRTAALLAPLLLAASPVVLIPAPAAFVDHMALFHVATAALLLSRRVRPTTAGIALAAAFATKLTTGPAVLGLALLAAWRSPRRRVATFVAVLVPVFVAFAPFALRNFRETGDPVYPVGYGLLGKPIPGVSTESVRFATRYHSATGLPLGIAWGPDEKKVQADEVAGWHHLAGLAALVLTVTDPSTRFLLALVLPYALLSIPFRPPTRYLLPALWALSALEAHALSRIGRRTATAVAAIAVVPAFLYASWSVVTGFGALDYLAGRIDRRSFLVRAIPGFRAAELVNGLPPGGRVMALDFPAPYYFDRPWIVEGILNDPPLGQWVASGDSAAELLVRLRALDVRYLVVTPGYGGGTAASLLPLARDRREGEAITALRSRLRLLRTVDRVDVYEVPR